MLNAKSVSFLIWELVETRLDVNAPKKRLMLHSMNPVRLPINSVNLSSALT
jgi:hypothetical protein